MTGYGWNFVCAICYGVNILVSQYAILLTFESREEVGIHTIRLLKFFLKLSDFIPHKSHYVILHSSTDTDIKSDPLLNPTIILNFRLAIPPDNNLNLHETFRTPTNWQTLNNWNTFYQCQMWKYFFYYKNIFSMKIICSWNNGNCNDINFKDFVKLRQGSGKDWQGMAVKEKGLKALSLAKSLH